MRNLKENHLEVIFLFLCSVLPTALYHYVRIVGMWWNWIGCDCTIRRQNWLGSPFMLRYRWNLFFLTKVLWFYCFVTFVLYCCFVLCGQFCYLKFFIFLYFPHWSSKRKSKAIPFHIPAAPTPFFLFFFFFKAKEECRSITL